MINISRYEDLLNKGKAKEVAAQLKKYKGTDGRFYFAKAEAERMLGNFEAAITLSKKALKLYKLPAKAAEDEKLEHTANSIDMALALAKCYRTLGDAKEAYKIAVSAMEEAYYPDLEDFRIQALQEMAMALRAAGKLDEAAALLHEVMAYYKAQGDIAGQSFIHWALGGILRLKGQFKDGIKDFNTAITLAKKAGDKISEAYGYCGLAGISRIAGDIKACVDNYMKAEKIFKNTDDIFGKAYTNCGMANGLRQLGRYDEALKRYAVADILYTAINDRVDLGFVKWGKADCLKRFGKIKEARSELESAKKLFAASDEIRGQLLTEFSLAQVMYVLGDSKKAGALYDRALARVKKEGLHTHLEVFT